MRHTPHYVITDPEQVKRLIREHPWATMVSPVSTGLVASHYPILLEEDAEGISIVSHVGRPDDRLHELGEHELLVIVQGAHGYVSPSWYDNGEIVPTWNHATAHLYGVPEILTEEENYAVLAGMVDHFEAGVSRPVSLAMDEAASRRLALGTVGFRMRVTRFEGRLKLSQNKTAEVVERVIGALETPGPYASSTLAEEMRQRHGTSLQ